MNWRKRVKVCKLQADANVRFLNNPIGGVRITDKDGNVEYINSHPKTDWAKELMIAKEHVQDEIVQARLNNQLRKQRKLRNV